ncbi:MAG: hypothetical protein ACI4O4_08880 [Candidatus Ventricola sp.]
MKQAWYRKPEAGNDTLRYKGDYITMMKSKFGTAWGIIYKGNSHGSILLLQLQRKPELVSSLAALIRG